MDIVDKVERYYANPNALKAVGENAIRLIRESYSLEAQMGPRIELLREIIRNPIVSSHEVGAVVPAGAGAQVIEFGTQRRSSRAWDVLRRTCPKPIKKFYRVWKRNYVSQ